MRHLLACLAILFAVNMSAQPYNPDANGDGVLSASDLLPFLGGFGQPFTVVDSTNVFEYQFPATDWEIDYWVQIPLCDVAVLTTTNIGSCGGSCYRVYLPDSAPDFHELTVIKKGYFSAGGYVVEETLTNAPNDPEVNYSFIGDNGLDNDGYRGLSRFMFFDGTWYTVGDQQ